MENPNDNTQGSIWSRAPTSRKLVLAAAILASTMGFIDMTMVALSTPAIRTGLGASLVEAQWVSNGYMLPLSSLVLLGGAAGDAYGTRNAFALGIAAFIVTSIACASAPDALFLILSRGAQGVGAAFMVPGSLAIIVKAFPPEERGGAIGLWAAASSLATATGPFLGGLVLSLDPSWSWRLVFLSNVPIGAATLAILIRHAPRDKRRDQGPLDLVGAILATAALGALAWGLTAIGPSGGPGPLVLGALGGSAALFALFVAWERRTKSPLVKIGLFASRPFVGANLYTLLVFVALNALLFFLPMTVISAQIASEWQASLSFLPLSLAIALLSGTAGRAADRMGARRPMTGGAIVVGLAFVGLGYTLPFAHVWTSTLPWLTLMGIGMAALVSPLSTAVMAAVSDDDTGQASGINNAVARAGGLVAVAAFGAVASTTYDRILSPFDLGIDFGSRPVAVLPAVSEAARVSATMTAFQWIAVICAMLCFIAAFVAWATQSDRR